MHRKHVADESLLYDKLHVSQNFLASGYYVWPAAEIETVKHQFKGEDSVLGNALWCLALEYDWKDDASERFRKRASNGILCSEKPNTDLFASLYLVSTFCDSLANGTRGFFICLKMILDVLSLLSRSP